MFSDREEAGQRIIDGIRVDTKTREIEDFNILEVEAGTTGFCGGDSGHGARTYFRIEDLGCTDIRPIVIENGDESGIVVVLGGDAELRTTIEALKFITRVLEDKAKITEENA